MKSPHPISLGFWLSAMLADVMKARPVRGVMAWDALAQTQFGFASGPSGGQVRPTLRPGKF
jgi:hypothetical protein